MTDVPQVTTPAALRQFVRRCQSAGPQDSVWLRASARSPDGLVAGNAVKALGRLGLLSGDVELLDALGDDAPPRVRQEIVVALVSASDAEAQARLAAITAEDAALADLARHARAALAPRR